MRTSQRKHHRIGQQDPRSIKFTYIFSQPIVHIGCKYGIQLIARVFIILIYNCFQMTKFRLSTVIIFTPYLIIQKIDLSCLGYLFCAIAADSIHNQPLIWMCLLHCLYK